VPSDPAATLAHLVAAHHAVFDGLLAATADLDDDAWSRATGCPGWDVHDQLAHCVGLERRMLGDEEVDPHVVVADAPHLTDGIKRHLERDVAARRGWPASRLIAEAEETFDRRREALAATTPDALGERIVGPMGPMKLSGALRMRVFDLVSHERDVRGALGRIDGWEGPHVELAVGSALRGWAARWPDAVDHADGAVRVEVAGAGPAVIDLADGTLHADADADGDPVRVTLRLTAPQALALAGGRDDAPQAAELDLGGDGPLAATLLAHAAMTP
jgi:uncharacterized protein (TIGR03083 family)